MSTRVFITDKKMIFLRIELLLLTSKLRMGRTAPSNTSVTTVVDKNTENTENEGCRGCCLRWVGVVNIWRTFLEYSPYIYK